jgi:hypothetical protein
MLDGDSNFFTGWRWLQLSPLLSGRSPGFVVMRAAGQARRSRRYILPDAGRLHPRADSTRVLGGSALLIAVVVRPADRRRDVMRQQRPVRGFA